MLFRSVVQLLLARDDIEVNSKSYYGKTPLGYAVEGGHLEVVQLLLARDNVDVEAANVRNFEERTPLELAAERGHFEVVELFRLRDAVSRVRKGESGSVHPCWKS